MTERSVAGEPSRLRIVAAFAAVYVIWGSTYLAIRFAVETLPPFLMAGVRFVIAGAILYAWARLRGVPRPAARYWVPAAIAGGLLLLGGNGAVVWAEQYVPSGVTALLVAMEPTWIVLLDWRLRGREARPDWRVVSGIALGLTGLMLLIGPGDLLGGGAVDPIGAAVLVLGTVLWAAGSLYSRDAPMSGTPILYTGMQMLAGGALLLVAGAATGELVRLDPAAVSVRSLLALAYLIVFGAIVGFTAYVWLLRVVDPAKVATHAFVNPIVAVVLGWALADEALTPRILSAAAVIVVAVAMITAARRRRTVPEVVEQPALPLPPRSTDADDATPPARPAGVSRRTAVG